MESSKLGNFFDDFEVGQVIRHSLSKTIVESDNNLFSLLTMNHHPIHLNKHFSRGSQHGKILVVGTLVFSTAVGITVPDISGKAIANLEYGFVKHVAPVFIDDTIYVTTSVLSKVPSKSKDDRGVVGVESVVTNQNGHVVLVFQRKVLIKKRPK